MAFAIIRSPEIVMQMFGSVVQLSGEMSYDLLYQEVRVPDTIISKPI